MKYNFERKEDKHFFAGLFNTAQNNFDLSIKELGRRTLDVGQRSGIEIIKYALAKERPLKDIDNTLKYLSESLVFVKHLKSYVAKKNVEAKKQILVERDFIKETLIKFYRLIEDYRNYYTHFVHDAPKALDETLAELLEIFLFTSALNIKKERVKTEENKERLYNKYATEYQAIFVAENKDIRDKFQDDPELHKKLIKENDKKGFVLNKMFHSFIYKDEKGDSRLKDKAIREDDTSISKGGLTQLLALFLNKKQLEVLFDNTNYLKSDYRLEHQVVRWVYSYMSYRDIRRLFRSDYDNDSLLLQMISELTKCPYDLYPHLSEENKQEFVEDMNEYLKENARIGEDQTVSHEIIRKRYKDKFPYFAIRFLDEFAKFPSLRFHVSLGKFNHNTADKIYKGTGLSTKRQVLEKLTVFEKLSVATNKKTAYIENLKPEEKQEDTGWVEYPRPKYQFFQNSIGIWLSMGNDMGKSDALDIREKGKDSKFDIAAKLNLKENIKKPVAYLSFNELSPLLHALLIEKKTAKEVEGIIRTKIFEQQNAIRSITETYSYQTSDRRKLPLKIDKINKFNGVDWDKLKTSIDAESKVTPLETIRQYYKKQPKEYTVLSLSEKGKIATWLSKDIKRFVRKETKRDWKAHQFSEFQALLSYYDINKEELLTFVKEELELDLNKDNPFSGIDFSQANLFDFHKNYLEKRADYLKGLIETIDNKDDWEENREDYLPDLWLPFRKRNFTLKSLETYKKDLLKQPVMLPKGLFEKNILGQDKQQLASWFTASMNRATAQEFYNFDKEYEYSTYSPKWSNKNEAWIVGENIKTKVLKTDKGIKEQLEKILEKNSTTSVSITKELQESLNKKNSDAFIKFRKDIYKTEKKLSRTMRNDFYMLEMIKKMMRQNESEELNEEGVDALNLKQLFLTKKEKEEIKDRSIDQSQRETGDRSENIYNESYILSRRVKVSLLGDKITGEVALKNIGKSRKIANDERVRQLVSYTDKVWSFVEIGEELEDYENIRNKIIFKTIHDLENKIYTKANAENKEKLLEQEGNPNFKHYLSYYFIKDENERIKFNGLKFNETTIDDIDENFKRLYLLAKIRNKFSHNQLLPKQDFEYLTAKFPKNSIEKTATYLNRVFEEITKEVL